MKKNYNFPAYTILETSILMSDNINAQECVLYALITSLSNNQDFCCYASNKYLAELMRCDTRSIQRMLKTLKEKEYIISIMNEQGNKRKLQPVINKMVEKKKEILNLFDYDWLNEEEGSEK